MFLGLKYESQVDWARFSLLLNTGKKNTCMRLKLIISSVNDKEGMHEQGVNNFITRIKKVHVDGC